MIDHTPLPGEPHKPPAACPQAGCGGTGWLLGWQPLSRLRTYVCPRPGGLHGSQGVYELECLACRHRWGERSQCGRGPAGRDADTGDLSQSPPPVRG